MKNYVLKSICQSVTSRVTIGNLYRPNLFLLHRGDSSFRLAHIRYGLATPTLMMGRLLAEYTKCLTLKYQVNRDSEVRCI